MLDPAPKRRLLALSVRGLMALVLVVGAVLGWIAHRAWARRQAIPAIEAAGGHVSFAKAEAGTAWDWVRLLPRGEQLWLDHFATADHVYLSGPRVDDAVMSHVGRLEGVVELHLPDAAITDAGLRQIRGVSGLVSLNLEGTAVTDAGMEDLRGLSHLETLDVGRTRITDTGLEALEGSRAMRDLVVKDTAVTPGVMARLRAARPDLKILP